MKKQGLLWLFAPAALATGALCYWAGIQAPRAGEPWPLRWVRTAASHPIRTGLALALIWGSFHCRQPTKIGSGSAKQERGSS